MSLRATDKLFVQLQPDAAGITYLQQLQANLHGSEHAKLVTHTDLHLTVIHIGLLQRLLQAMRPHTTMSTAAILEKAQQLANALQAITEQDCYQTLTLEPKNYELLGKHKSTFVVTLRTSPIVQQLHVASLQRLQQFFTDCGITDITTFMAADENLQFALIFKPHITLAKAYKIQSTFQLSQSLTCSPMPVIYKQ